MNTDSKNKYIQYQSLEMALTCLCIVLWMAKEMLLAGLVALSPNSLTIILCHTPRGDTDFQTSLFGVLIQPYWVPHHPPL